VSPSIESRGGESLEQSLPERVALLPGRLRFARSLAQLSASELTRLAGFSSMGYASCIESGAHGPSVRTAARVAEVLGLSLDWLIAGKGPEPDPDQVKEAVEAARARGPLARSQPEIKKGKKHQTRARSSSPPEGPPPEQPARPGDQVLRRITETEEREGAARRTRQGSEGGGMTGQSIIWLRRHLTMDRTQFAQLFGVSPSTLPRCERADSGVLQISPLQLQLLTLLPDQVDQRSAQERAALGQELSRRILLGGGLRGLFCLLEVAFGEEPPARKSSGSSSPSEDPSPSRSCSSVLPPDGEARALAPYAIPGAIPVDGRPGDAVGPRPVHPRVASSGHRGHGLCVSASEIPRCPTDGAEVQRYFKVLFKHASGVHCAAREVARDAGKESAGSAPSDRMANQAGARITPRSGETWLGGLRVRLPRQRGDRPQDARTHRQAYRPAPGAPLGWSGSAERETERLARRFFAVFYPIGDRTQREHVAVADRLFARLSVGKDAGQRRHFGDPTPVVFTVGLYSEFHRGTVAHPHASNRAREGLLRSNVPSRSTVAAPLNGVNVGVLLLNGLRGARHATTSPSGRSATSIGSSIIRSVPSPSTRLSRATKSPTAPRRTRIAKARSGGAVKARRAAA
jgi:transcriptional regulator with XRE-family HTH domain